MSNLTQLVDFFDFKIGDRVCLIVREDVTGSIIDMKKVQKQLSPFATVTETKYKIKYDNPDLIPQEDWHFSMEITPLLISGNTGCFHKWETYIGFLNSDEYCLVCGEKREIIS